MSIIGNSFRKNFEHNWLLNDSGLDVGILYLRLQMVMQSLPTQHCFTRAGPVLSGWFDLTVCT